jgi:transcriptional regulator with AAA-type ATPase domain/NAD-dependent dihydropyrimidine dehydrogenase PreA subunit
MESVVNAIEERVQWLRNSTILGELPTESLTAIAESIAIQTVAENHRVVLEDTLAENLYILRRGQLESYRTNPTTVASALSLLPGSILHLPEIVLRQPVQRTVITLSDCEFWVISAAHVRHLAIQFPDLNQVVIRQLAEDLADLSSRLLAEQERQMALRPYLIPRAKRGVVGTSRYADRLRQQIKAATRDRKPVVIFGEPGLEKDNLAALIHFGSAHRRQSMVQLNCGLLQPNGADLFGRVGGKPGFLELVESGTVVLNNIQDLPPALLPAVMAVLETGTYRPISRTAEETPPETVEPKTTLARLILISEKSSPAIERIVGHVIKVPPLRVRKADLKAQTEYYISLYCQTKHIPKPKLSPEALRRLQAYSFPNNLRELNDLVVRAIAQRPDTPDLTEEVFWTAQTRRQVFRVNLLNAYPQLRYVLRSDWWPTRINYGFTLSFFALIVVTLFVGPQHRHENAALNLFWAWWWPLILIGFPFVGRLWCAVCPFMIYGELVQTLSLKLWPRQLKRWPRETAERWGGWFLLGLFTLIFLWEELWNLEDTAYLSSCLLLLITAGAVVFSLLFERRFWCRYLCPIGGMNGLFAKLSMTELRAQQGTCSAECTTYQCYKGGPAKGEGQETDGCPLYSHPAQLTDNRDCVLCMTCLKACPHRSVEFNLRPPGIELWTTHTPRTYEVGLLLLLLGGIFLHRLPELQAIAHRHLPLSNFGIHAGVSVLVLAIAAGIPLLGHQVLCLWSTRLKPRPFIELAYGYLPLVLGGTLAHYLQFGLGEAGRILPVTWATIGLVPSAALPIWVAHPAVITFLEGVTLIFATLISVWTTQKIARQPLWNLLPQHLSIVGLATLLWLAIVVY